MDRGIGFVLIVLFLFLIFFSGVTGAIVYFSIKRSVGANKKYESFAQKHGYIFDRAQGRACYRDTTKRKRTGMILKVQVVENPYIAKYANYNFYPFGKGTNGKIVNVIQGIYQGTAFRAFTYIFTGSYLQNTGPGGVFSVVMIKCENQPSSELAENMFFEKSTLCEYLKGNLEVDAIHERIENLKQIGENR